MAVEDNITHLLTKSSDSNAAKPVHVSNLQRAPRTLHFNAGNIGAPTLAAVPGTAEAAAMSYFGQINIERDCTLSAIHLHVIEGGTLVDLAVDVFVRRDGVFTLITQLALSGTVADFAVDSGTLAVTELLAGDYLFAQPTAATLGGVDGMTIDIHFAADWP